MELSEATGVHHLCTKPETYTCGGKIVNVASY